MQAVAKANAEATALEKIASAVVATKPVGKGENKREAWQELADEDDILDEQEKVKIGLREKGLRVDV